jgi:cytochrome c oxidase cbb3-type subunit I/II
MWTAGIMQGLMLGEVAEGGTTLKYEFVETLKAIQLPYILRSIGGGLYLIGFFLCAWNIFKTARSGQPHDDTVEVAVTEKQHDKMPLSQGLFSDPVAYTVAGLAAMILWFFLPPHADKAALLVAVLLTVQAIRTFRRKGQAWDQWHESLLRNYLPFTLLIFFAVAIGGGVQIVPALLVNRAKNVEGRLQELYTPLELAGRDLYVSEGCYNCHSQMIRTLVPDVMRYGRANVKDDFSHLGESLYDHPYQWGSKRTGPDLAREGGPLVAGSTHVRTGKRDNKWHWFHFMNPRWANDDSNMPPYPWLYEKKTDFKSLPSKIAVQSRLGVPYPAWTKDEIDQQAREQGMAIARSLFEGTSPVGYEPMKGASTEELVRHFSESQVVAMIAYIQKVGTYQVITKDGLPAPTPLDPDSYRKVAAKTEAFRKGETTINP